MKGFSNLDLFQKVALDGINQPTLIGSIFSILAIALMIYLFIESLIIQKILNINHSYIIFQKYIG